MELGMNEILTIMDKVERCGLSSFEYEHAGTKLKIRGSQKEAKTDRIRSREEVLPDAPEVRSEKGESDGRVITSPIVGTFYAAPSEKEAPFVAVGDTVKKGQTLGIVEAMKLMNEIQADCDGTVTKILVTNEQVVEFGQPLFCIAE